ncbi:MAG TPA: hypothetical protein VMY37_30480 [Thermoguttaceae bacterium]|nr:hypothetical protein [Thermoguttaceae bacterium]
MMSYRGRVHNGVVVLEGGVKLPEGAAVKVETIEASLPEETDDRVYRLAELASPTGIPDLALNIDHYLYGHPKVDDARE